MQCDGLLLCAAVGCGQVNAMDFISLRSKIELSFRCVRIRSYVDVHKGQLYDGIIRIIADKSERFSHSPVCNLGGDDRCFFVCRRKFSL
jgi:hypothetical protein